MKENDTPLALSPSMFLLAFQKTSELVHVLCYRRVVRLRRQTAVGVDPFHLPTQRVVRHRRHAALHVLHPRLPPRGVVTVREHPLTVRRHRRTTRGGVFDIINMKQAHGKAAQTRIRFTNHFTLFFTWTSSFVAFDPHRNSISFTTPGDCILTEMLSR